MSEIRPLLSNVLGNRSLSDIVSQTSSPFEAIYNINPQLLNGINDYKDDIVQGNLLPISAKWHEIDTGLKAKAIGAMVDVYGIKTGGEVAKYFVDGQRDMARIHEYQESHRTELVQDGKNYRTDSRENGLTNRARILDSGLTDRARIDAAVQKDVIKRAYDIAMQDLETKKEISFHRDKTDSHMNLINNMYRNTIDARHVAAFENVKRLEFDAAKKIAENEFRAIADNNSTRRYLSDNELKGYLVKVNADKEAIIKICQLEADMKRDISNHRYEEKKAEILTEYLSRLKESEDLMHSREHRDRSRVISVYIENQTRLLSQHMDMNFRLQKFELKNAKEMLKIEHETIRKGLELVDGSTKAGAKDVSLEVVRNYYGGFSIYYHRDSPNTTNDNNT